jgi:protein tyrosine phosphatase (PTP) superfamily phosphohydrolase (DUF442 family)
MKTSILKSMLTLTISCLFVACAQMEVVQAGGVQAPNVVPISATIVTSGQPTATSLAQLGAQGFVADIYLAPVTVDSAVPGEEDIVRKQGLDFVNIPIQFGKPTDADFQSFVAAMNRYKGRKVLVHCEVNMRASSMTFLYRTIIEHVDPQEAYEAVSKVWVPRGAWHDLITTELAKANIAFTPY